MNDSEALRRLPQIDRILQTERVAALKRGWLSRIVDEEVRDVVDEVRARIRSGEDVGELTPEALAEQTGLRLESRLGPGVVRCVNATGVVLHTGLGRAVLARQAREALAAEAAGYCVVSVDREEGARIRRESTVARLLCALTGAEAATMVNNNAAATLIALNTLAAGKEAILSRGQLVEIGGSFRMPEVFESAGVRLREVGTTNRTYLRDYAGAIGPETGLLLRVHPSNYRVVGFTSEPSIEELVGLGREQDLPVLDDLGAGALVELPPEPLLSASLRAGADLICCSGDKLIGGPQAGLLLGSRTWVDRVRRNPLFRALRPEKLALAAMEATLRLYLRAEGPGDDHPTLRMLRLPLEAIKRRARSLRTRLRRALPWLDVGLRTDEHSQVGSGSLPGTDLPTVLVTLAHAGWNASGFARDLRRGEPPVYTRIVDDTVCIDPRTLQDGDERLLLQALERLRAKA